MTHSDTIKPSAAPLRKVTNPIVDTLTKGKRLPKTPTKQACIRPRIINSARTRTGLIDLFTYDCLYMVATQCNERA